MTVPPIFRSRSSTVSAAGFIATSTSTASPGVITSPLPKWIWNADTPNVVPVGALISAGKSGNVEKSLPASAVSSVNWLPVTCIPSPESPANRITTESRVSRCRLEIAEVTMPVIYTTLRSTNHTFAGRSARRRMYQANQALP